MLPTTAFALPARSEILPAGTCLRRRGQPLECVLHLDHGRVRLGIADEGRWRHQFGTVEGPFWLDAVDALLGLPALMDMWAETSLSVRRISLEQFREDCAALPQEGQGLLHDVAQASRRQQELSVNRLAQDAEARCAQWLLAHAERDEAGGMFVSLKERKRLIAAQLGIAPETFSRVLRQLREHGLIAGSGKLLNVLQPLALQSLAL